MARLFGIRNIAVSALTARARLVLEPRGLKNRSTGVLAAVRPFTSGAGTNSIDHAGQATARRAVMPGYEIDGRGDDSSAQRNRAQDTYG
jgi:hypothetical protein